MENYEYYYPGGSTVSTCSIKRDVSKISDEEWEQMKVNADEDYRVWLDNLWTGDY